RPGRWDRLRARRYGLVVHTVALGPDLREHPEYRGDRPTRDDRRVRRSHKLLRGAWWDVHSLDGRRDPGFHPDLARHEDLRPHPEVLLLRRGGGGRERPRAPPPPL